MSMAANARSSGSSHPVKICIKAQDGTEEFYTVSSSSYMQKLLFQYCKDKGVEYQSMNFVFQHRRLVANRKTLSEVGLKDGDEIAALINQNGG